jgi:hypothetical protein
MAQLSSAGSYHNHSLLSPLLLQSGPWHSADLEFLAVRCSYSMTLFSLFCSSAVLWLTKAGVTSRESKPTTVRSSPPERSARSCAA